MHDNNIIHRDLKPHNVMVNEKNEVYLIDFQKEQSLCYNWDIETVFLPLSCHLFHNGKAK